MGVASQLDLVRQHTQSETEKWKRNMMKKLNYLNKHLLRIKTNYLQSNHCYSEEMKIKDIVLFYINFKQINNY